MSELETTQPALPTSIPSAQPDASTSEVQRLQSRYRELQKLLLRCEAGDFEGVLPGYSLIPKHQQQQRLLNAVQGVVREVGQIMHKLNSATTGPKKASAAKAPAKAKPTLDDL